MGAAANGGFKTGKGDMSVLITWDVLLSILSEHLGKWLLVRAEICRLCMLMLSARLSVPINSFRLLPI